MVSVVDAANLLADYSSHDFLQRPRRDARYDQTSARSSISWSNRSSSPTSSSSTRSRMCEPETLASVRRSRRRAQSRCAIVETDFGHVPLGGHSRHRPVRRGKGGETSALAQGTLRLRRPRSGDGRVWHFELCLSRPPAVRSHRASTTFPQADWPGLIRAKGHFWLATRPDWVGLFPSPAAACASNREARGGRRCRGSTGRASRNFGELLDRHWTTAWGDRRQELVFIGTGLDEAAIRAGARRLPDRKRSRL